MTEFSDKLLSAIGRWQRGWREDQPRRLEIGEELITVCSDLDLKFRTINSPCYRKRFIHSRDLIPFITRNLIEGPASWTLDPKFAENFKGIERPDALMGTIFIKSPAPDEVIVNLDALWRDSNFQSAVDRYSAQGGSNFEALLHFKGTQREIVLQSHLLPEEIYAMSGRSSDFETLCEQAGINDENIRDKVWKDLVEDNIFPGDPKWINQAGALRVMNNVATRFSKLIEQYKKIGSK